MKKGFLIVLSAILLITSFLFTACDSWMQDDDFYSDIENDVKVANAAAVNAYVRYANSKMGTTEPSGSISKKVDVPFSVSAVTNDDYGFVKWVAFSTSDFPTNQQHTSLVYESAQAYARDYKGKELSSGFVSFTDPTNTITDVNIYAVREDIFIMPLVAKRPTVVTSVPSNGRTDVVKNSQIRILFSKPIDESTLVDEFGNSNIQVTSGRAVLTENSDDLDALDITSHFNIKLSKTKKMLTISAKRDATGKAFLFDGNSQISVNIFEDVCDTDGFKMNGSYKFSFTTGTKEDSLAPYIEKLSAGIGEDCMTFQQYRYSEDLTNRHTRVAEEASNDLDDYIALDNALSADKQPILKQRVKDKVNIYVRASDIAGAGANVTIDSNTTSENDVALIQIRASLYADKGGNPVTTSAEAFANNSSGTDSSSVLAVREFGYALGMKDSGCQIKKNFEDIKDENDNNLSSGTIFTYDLSGLADGLVKIDLWAVDMVGNSGDSESYTGTYDNGYRSIFVVKDSTAPDAATEVSKVITESGSDTNGVAAPYEWYNVSSLSKLQVKDQEGSSNLIHDASNEFLRSKDNKLKWIFKVGNDTSWAPSPSAAGWTDIHNDSNQPIVRTLSDAVSSADGPVAVTMCLMDDLGNVSSPVLLQSIMYDNTAPVLPSTVSWVQNTSTTAGTYAYSYIVSTTDSADLSTSGHILKIPFTEEWAGLRRIKVTVQKDGTGTAVPQGNYTIRYVPASGSARNLSYTASSSDNTLKILSGSNSEYDAAPIKTGNLYISGIKIGNENGGSYRVTVDLWDSSLNHSVTHSDISIDTTAPELKKVYIPGLKQSINATSSGVTATSDDGWILPREYVKGPSGQSSGSSVAPAYIPLYLFVKEADSGIHKISFASTDDVKLFNDTSKKTTLYKIENFGQTGEVRTLVPESDYTIDTTAKTITLVDNPTVKLSSPNENGFVILVKDIGFKTYKPDENKIDVTVTDLATLSGNNNKLSPYTSGSTEITGVKVDSYLYSSPTYTLKDRGTSTESLAAESGYTNEAIIDVDISVGADAGSSAISGYNSFKLSGAKFIPEQTEVIIGSTSITYQLSENNTVLTLRQKEGTDFAETDKYIVLRNKTFTIKNIQLDDSTSDGVKSLSITTYDLAGWNHTVTTKTITLDRTPPVLSKGPFTAALTNSNTDYDSAKTVYPHADGENATGEVIGGIPTFYTSKPTDSSQSNGVLLGIRATDNIALSGNTGNTPFLRIVSGNNMSKADILSSESTYNLSVKNSDSGNTVKNSRFDIRFTAGAAYGGVIVDKAGNCSDVFKFKVQEDSTAPVMKDSANKSLNEYVYMEAPDAGSGIYKNEIDSFSNYDEFEYRNYTTQSDQIRTKKIVTKKSSGKYKIILNLAAEKYVATNEVTRLINGTEPDSGANYAELAPTATSAPIEEYAIRTVYTDYPKPDYHNTSYTLSTPGVEYWHKYKNRTGTSTNTDSYNKISSYVEGNNLIILLPQQNTAPVSVFLKDACGNYSSIVLGLQGDGTTENYQIAPSFILDDHLGYAATDANGEVVTPIVIQNPYMTSGAGDSEGPAWGNEGRYKWNNQSGNAGGEPAGERQHFGFFRDDVKKATYYNPDLFSPQTFKIGFTLRFGSTFQSSTNPESVTFAAKQKAPDADVTVGKYTARALLYCTQSSTKPSKQDILDCYNSEFGSGGERTGRITEWTYVQAGNLETEVTMLLDYPKPDYTKLTGWTLKNSNGEPEPYYIWYLYEDRIGNYEIAKLVNSGALGNDLKGTKAGMYDRWFYDGDGPKITVRSTGADPKELNATQAAVDTLVAKNNGYVPYLKPSSDIVYVRSGYGEALRASSLENTNLGWGTTHHVENAGGTQYYRIYEPFMDLEVSERTGIRAFAWSTSPTAPGYSDNGSTVQWDGNTQGDATGKWYAGFKATDLHADIGCGHTYTGDTTNPYFSFTDSSSSYKGVYSGTKINTVIPSTLLSTSEARPLYLHVMDWTGNITTVRMGENLKFIKDTTFPAANYRATGVIDKTRSVDGEYYVSSEYYAGDGTQGWMGINQIWVRIAGLGDKAKNHDPIKVRIPDDYFVDGTYGSGNKGFGTSDKYINSVKIDETGPYLEFDYDTYKDWPSTGTPVEFYFYDNVGNQDWWKVICCFDTEAPVLRTISFVTEAGKNTEFLHEDTVTDQINEVDGFGKVTNYHKRAATKHDDVSHFGADEVQEIYVNKEGTSRFHVNFDAAVPDLADIKVNKWNAATSKWDTVTSYKSNSTEWESSNDNNGIHRYYTMKPYNKLTYSAEGTYYQIIATDKSSNAAYQYFKIYLDNQAPAFTPTVTVTKGSVNKDTTADVYYYTADAEHKMTVNFTLDDGSGIGSKIANGNFHYYYRIGNTGDFTQIDSSNVSLEFTDETVESIYVKDELGNISSAIPLKYVYGSGENDYKEISKLQFYNTEISTASTYTAQGGWPNYYQDNSCTIMNDPAGILLKSKYYNSVKITFTKPAGIIGYVEDSASTAPGAYSMKALSNEFEVSLPDNKEDTSETFYAVDYIGQTRKIDLLLTYNNPLAAKDIVFLPADSAEIPDSIKAELTLTPTVDDGSTRYYKNGWVVVRCTLKKNDAETEYSAVPTTVKLYNTDSINNNTQALSTHTGSSNLRGYTSTESVGEGANKRYYYYFAFKLSDSHKDKKLYCVMSDASNNTSDATALGNVTWKQDTEAPTITSQYVVTENSINKLKGFVLTDSENNVISSIGKARDSFKGNGYQSNLYPSGARVFFKWRHSSSNQYIKDNSGTIAKYKFVVTTPETASNEYFNATASVSDADWKDITLQPFASDIFENAYCYMFELPDNFAPHCHLALFLMDKFGNVSAPYYLIHEANNTKVQWWLTEQTFTDYTFVSNADHTTYSIKLPLGTVINNISVNGAEIDSFKFIDYTKGDPSVSDLSNGWIVLKGSDAVGLTVTLKNLAADWSEKPVNLKINNVEKTVYTIPAKTLTADDIQLGTATPSETAGQYTISATIPDAAKSRISEDPVVTGTNITGVTAAWNGDKSVITITGASSIWDGDRTIGLTIKTSDGNFDKNNVLSVGKKTINGSGFSLGTMDSENKVLVTFTDISTPATIINASGHNLMVGKTPESEGSVVSGATVEYDSTTKKFTITGMPGPAWSGQQNFTIKVNTLDGNFDNGGIIHTVAQRTLSVSDLTISDVDPATWSNSIDAVSFKITAASGITIQSVNAQANHSCTSNNGTYTISPSNTGAKIPQGISVEVVTDKGTKTKYIYLPANEVDANIRGTGFTAGGIRAVIGGTVAEEVSGSRFVQFINTVTDTFSTDSDFTADSSVTEKSAKKAKKAAKKAKKQGKKASAKVVSTGSTTAGSGVTAGKPVMAVETAEILDQTLTSAVPELTAATESVVSEIAGITEKAAGKSEVIATVEANEKMVSTDSTTEEAEQASAEEGSRSPSKSASIVIMLAILSSFGAVWYLQRNRKK